MSVELDMHFYGDTSALPEGCCCSLSLVVRVILISGRDLPDIQRVGEPSLYPPLSLFLTENNSIVIYSWGCWPLGQGRDERFSFYFPFIATGKHRAGDDVISSREGSRELKPPAGPKRITSQWIVTFARIFL